MYPKKEQRSSLQVRSFFRMSSTVFSNMLVLLGCKDRARMTGAHYKWVCGAVTEVHLPLPGRPKCPERQALLFPLSERPRHQAQDTVMNTTWELASSKARQSQQ